MLKYSVFSFLFCSIIFSSEINRIQISAVLSGELLIGLGYTDFLQDDISIQFDAYLVPSNGLPFAFDACLTKYFGEQNLKPQIGAGFAAIVSPPDPEKRKVLFLFNLSPGMEYRFGKYSFSGGLWVSYFINQNKNTIIPTGIKFQLGRGLE